MARTEQEPVIVEIMRIFGWQGGTIHQVVAHVRNLQEFHDAWVDSEVAKATGSPEIAKKARTLLITAHHRVRSEI